MFNVEKLKTVALAVMLGATGAVADAQLVTPDSLVVVDLPGGARLEMVHVEGGTFTMGNDAPRGLKVNYDASRPEHRVTVGDYYVGRYEVTQAQWQAVMGENPSYFQAGGYAAGVGDSLPVERVSWTAAQQFCTLLSQMTGRRFRLPTEAEWEYAARGGAKGQTFSYSGSNKADEVAWYKGNSQLTPHEVGSKQPNALGLFDMSGNVWEWCYDYYDKDYYKKSPEDNPDGPSKGSDRVYRGGCWTSGFDDLRMTSRHSFSQNKEYGMIGIRLAQDN